MTPRYSEEDLTVLRSNATRAEEILKDAVLKLCPGPHAPTQHRDGKVPWCKACHRTARGIKIGE